MSDEPNRPPLRVEQALRLLPEAELTAPLRALLVAASRPEAGSEWSSSGPYLTIGKRAVQPLELKRQVQQLARRVGEHIGTVYGAYVEALEKLQHGEPAGAVAALSQAGRLEEEAGRTLPAHQWLDAALALSEGLPERRPEIETLRLIGHLNLRQGRFGQAARAYQRSFALAEAEFDSASTVAACLGLGDVAVAQQEWVGAEAWYSRGLSLAKAAGAEHRMGELERQIGVLKRHTGDLTAAQDYLKRARERFETLGDAIELARVLNSQGELDGRLDRPAAALASYHEALAWRRRAGSDSALEVTIRRNLAELHLRADRFLEAEAEARRAEQSAIAENQLRQLIPVYILLGRLKGRQGDPTGFVFFEQAIELCRTVDHAPAVEGQMYYEYGAFKHGLGEMEEARAYFERARGLFESVGVTADLDRLRDEMGRRSA